MKEGNSMEIVALTKGNVDMAYKGRILRCWGDLDLNGFLIEGKSLQWLNEDGTLWDLTEEEKKEAIEALKHFSSKKFKIRFYEDKKRNYIKIGNTYFWFR